ncbi:MAG: hypothetical protein KKB74_07705 [Bacteroidetes bacterium]|nr:hypothetical protein [Bacteroidota bacterium]
MRLLEGQIPPLHNPPIVGLFRSEGQNRGSRFLGRKDTIRVKKDITIGRTRIFPY